MFCGKCGIQLNEGNEFCSKCGNKIGQSENTGNYSNGNNSQKVHAPGKGLLKVIGVLELIFGGINGFSIFIGFTMVKEMNAIQPLNFGVSYEAYYLLTFPLVCYCIFAGIMAVIHCATLEKASLLKKLGIVMLVLVIINGITVVVLMGLSAVALVPISIAMASIYIIGASKNETVYNNTYKNTSSNRRCRKCEKTFSSSISNCPYCGSSFYEETNQIAQQSSSNIPNRVNYGDAWVCKKCNTSNSITSSTCKDCGEYK
jgi:RNA polymerase subunit RPABC4/transcription elongation factor Spt4